MTHAESFSQSSQGGNPSGPLATSTSFLAGGGEMGERIRAFDWESTSLGPVEQWPQSLKTIVRIMLTSRQPIWIGWGPELIKLYNDPYRAIVGGKHPQALGQPASVVWREIWEAIGPRLQTAVQNNEGTYDESLLLLMERYGYPEETYYTFSYSPVPADHGGVGGIICANTDDTARIIGERQVKLLQTLAAQTGDARTITEACRLSARSLEHNPHDLPFALLYLLDQKQHIMRLAGTAGMTSEDTLAPANVALDAASFWPFAEVLAQQELRLIPNLEKLGIPLPRGAWKQPPHQAVVLPIAPAGQTGQAGVLIVGLNPFRRFDEGYQGFLTLVAGQIAASLGNAHAYEEERKRAEALAELDRAKTVFFSNVSHEFRTPLALMLGPLEDINRQPETLPINRERVSIAYRNALRLLKLVNTLLDFSRLEAGRIQASYEPTDLSHYTSELVSNFRPVAEQAGLQLLLSTPKLSEPVYVDRDMWEKIIFNLLSNAFKFTFAGVIEVRLVEEQEQIVITVRDTGVGIAQHDLPHIFERFQRVEGVKARSFEGSGIGLALVQELIKLHGGTIDVESILGAGTTFTIRLPKGFAHLPKEQIGTGKSLSSTTIGASFYVQEVQQWFPGQSSLPDLAPDLLPAAESMTQDSVAVFADRPRIVLADDNADMRAYVQRLLQDRFDVQAVSNGREALEAVRQQRTDLVLTDVMMPEMDGFQLLRALKGESETSRIPVLLVSARAGEEATIEGVRAGADDYIVKPFSARELLARVTTHIKLARSRYEAEQQLHDLFMQAPAAVVILRGASYVIELANPIALKIWGRSGPEVLNRPLFEALPEVRGQGLEPLLEGVLQTGTPCYGNELKVSLDRAGNGVLEDVYFVFVYAPLRSATETVEGIMVFAYEVTEQVLARQRLIESEARFRTLAESIPNLAWMARPDGWIDWYNSRWYAYTGTTPEQAVGWGWQSVLDPQAASEVLENWRYSLRTEEPFEMVFTLKGVDGVFRPFLTRAAPLRDSTGRVVQWFGTNTDITEQKRLEKQKEEFIGVASHELKTPITSIKAFVQLLERNFRQNGDTHSASLLHKVVAQVNRLTSLVEDLLDVTKIENGQLLFHFSTFAYNTLVGEVVEEMQRTATRHTIVQELAAPVSLYADRERIGQILTNLLTNAIKYSPRAEIVLVKTRLAGDAIVTSVQDFGIGIPAEKQAHLFERFYRVEGETQITYPGLGLGLYITAEFIKRHHGSIWVESVEGEGTTVSFSLPLLKDAETPDSGQAEQNQ